MYVHMFKKLTCVNLYVCPYDRYMKLMQLKCLGLGSRGFMLDAHLQLPFFLCKLHIYMYKMSL